MITTIATIFCLIFFCLFFLCGAIPLIMLQIKMIKEMIKLIKKIVFEFKNCDSNSLSRVGVDLAALSILFLIEAVVLGGFLVFFEKSS